ncbi:TonB-dependent receptor domain-containing protein [Pleionea mediterranea]|uniref:TonB-dependent receptor-like protein n=1 Tax=Pleionea mediterranea TaxID=523701 RepID=A0A316FZE1_9GAMM|nr:TonB-dependent receptor [Pleionea mediterranea]PWK54011.1 TonB-dependent receptor-like protein [Pleionea mediterranea]
MSTLNSNPIAKAVRTALLAGTAAALAIPAAYAAEAEDEGEKVVITGSRIQRVDIEGANPVTVITRDQIENTSATNFGEFLQTMPSSSGSPLGTTTNNGGNGSVSIDLRGLGTGRTLVLVNGKRPVDGGDLQTIPMVIVERVEILKDGASSVYGADAVAGVVNIITRSDFEGTEVEVEYSDTFDIDGASDRFRLSFVSGASHNKGNITFGAQWDKQQGIFQGDLDHDMYQFPLFVLDPDSYDGGLPDVNNPTFIQFGSSRTTQGVFDLPNGDTLTLIDGEDGNDPSDFRDAVLNFGPGNDLWNYAPVNYLQTPFERINFFMQSDYEFSEHAVFTAEMRYSERHSEQTLAPLPYDTNIYPGGPVHADNFYNPFGETLDRVRRRMIETGGRNFQQDVKQFQVVLGLAGYISDSSWRYDVSVNYGNRSRVDTDFGQFSGDRLENALGPSFQDGSGNIVCGTPGNVIDGCVPLNVFGGPGSISSAMLDYIGVALNDRFDTQIMVADAFVSGDLFDLPGGTATVAFGFNTRHESAAFIPDSSKVLGTVTGGISEATDGDYRTEAFYGEGIFPLISDVKGAEMLELSVGFRESDNEIFGSASTYQLGLKWKPIDDLLIRGTLGESFRAPAIGSLFSGQAQGASPNTFDPCRSANWGNLSGDQQSNCVSSGVPQGGWDQQDSQVTVIGGGNPNLKPEEGETTTFGIAWSPSFLDGFSMTVDWWDVQIDKAINSLSANAILDLCANFGQCDGVSRNSDGSINFVATFPLNVAFEEATGVDLEVKYSFDTEVGMFSTGLLWSRMTDRVLQESSVAEPIDLTDTYDPGLDASYPEDKAKITVDWANGDWGATYAIDYIGAINVPFSFFDGGYQTDAQFYSDAQVRYVMPNSDTRFSFGITNLTDEDPVYLDSGFNTSTDESTFRTFGRGYYFRVTQSF